VGAGETALSHNSLSADFSVIATLSGAVQIGAILGPAYCFGSFGHPNSTRLAAMGVLVWKAVCSRSDPRKVEHPSAARAHWLNYRVASHLHQLRQHENTSAQSASSEDAARPPLIAPRTRAIVGESISKTRSQHCIANVTTWDLFSCNCRVTVHTLHNLLLSRYFRVRAISAKRPRRTGRCPNPPTPPTARVRSSS
jgi:hypothetical protein